MRRRYLYCYDIANPGRLRRVHGALKNAGDRVQLSVYECQLTRREQVHLDARLKDVIHHEEDSVFIVELGEVRRERPPTYRTMGRPYVPRDRQLIVV